MFVYGWVSEQRGERERMAVRGKSESAEDREGKKEITSSSEQGTQFCAPLSEEDLLFAAPTHLLVALANIAMDPVPETQGVEEEVEQNKIDRDGEEGNKESEEVEEIGATRDEDGDNGVAIRSRTLNCAPKVIQLAFKPDGVTASKAEPEPPSK
ncbi:hypothetical protein BC835DRAFT_1310227 [Cytidiella melzeri]|nr:hypothetical protein BC835DRAFT_1310227 [Cytidiella melzeri]